MAHPSLLPATPPPKSTGREDFGPELLQQYHQQAQHLGPADWLATLTDLTAASIADSYKRFLPQLPQDLILCGGGSRNPYLKSRLQTHLPQTTLSSSDDWGLNADFKEAIAFAILAYWRLQGHPSNLPSVTGASKPVPLGDIHPPLTPPHLLPLASSLLPTAKILLARNSLKTSHLMAILCCKLWYLTRFYSNKVGGA